MAGSNKGLRGAPFIPESDQRFLDLEKASAAAAAIAAVSTDDGSDAATTQALANALKAKLNALIAALQN